MARWSRFEAAADRRLVKELTTGDKESLAKLYDLYAERLYDYCWSQLGETRASANIVHDTLIDAYRRVGRLRDRDRLRAWLYASVRRRCLLYGRGTALSWESTPANDATLAQAIRFEAFTRPEARAYRTPRPSPNSARSASRPGTAPPNGTARGVAGGTPNGVTNGAARAAANGRSGNGGSGNGGSGNGRTGNGSANANRDPVDSRAAAGNGRPPRAGRVGRAVAAVRGGRDTTAVTAAAVAAVPEATRGDGRAGSVDELCAWVYKAFQRMPPADQEVYFLAARHDLDVADLIVTLGESQRRVQARLAEGKAWMSGAVPAIDPDLALDVHATHAPPPELRNRVLHAGSDPELAAHRADIVARSGSLGPDGFPRQPGARVPLARRWIFAGGGLSVAVIGVALIVMLIGSGTPGDPGTWPFGSSPAPKPSRSVPSTDRPPDTSRPAPQPPAGQRGPGPGSGDAGGVPPRPPEQPPGPGVLTVRPDSIRLIGRDEKARIKLRAEQGAVTWTAEDSAPLISLSAKRGTIPAGTETILVVRLHRTLVQLPGKATVTLTDGTGQKHVVPVRWSLSLL